MTNTTYKNLFLFFSGALVAVLFCYLIFGGLLKYQKIDKILTETSAKPYSDSYNCINFSQDATRELQKQGIGSNVIVIDNPNGEGTHAVVSVWLDPQNNQVVTNTEYIGDYQALKTVYGWPNR